MATILVADDSETILLLMRTRLEMAGHAVAPRPTARRCSTTSPTASPPTCSCSTR